MHTNYPGKGWDDCLTTFEFRMLVSCAQFCEGRKRRKEIGEEDSIDRIFSSINRLIKNWLVICIVKIKLLLLLKYTNRINVILGYRGRIDVSKRTWNFICFFIKIIFEAYLLRFMWNWLFLFLNHFIKNHG